MYFDNFENIFFEGAIFKTYFRAIFKKVLFI